MGQMGLFDWDDRLKDLSRMHDPLEPLACLIPWGQFRPLLEKAFQKDRKGPQGRIPFDRLLMLKILILQSLYSLSDHAAEFQIKDRLSFQRFLGLSPGDRVPDEKTIWLFREDLSKEGGVMPFFRLFEDFLHKAGYKASRGQIVDATIMEVPKQRNTKEENEEIKKGQTPESLSKDKNVLRQKDLDARWTKKRDVTYFGYKDHVVVDSKHKLIRSYTVTDASVHDSQALRGLIAVEGAPLSLYGDSAYQGIETRLWLKDWGHKAHFCEKGTRNSPLTQKQKEENRKKSRVRARVEHTFGWMFQKTRKVLIRGVGKVRVSMKIGMLNLSYNLSRYCTLEARAA